MRLERIEKSQRLIRRRALSSRRHGQRRVGTCGKERYLLRTGSAGGVYRHPQILSRRGRRGGVGRRGRQNHLYHGRHGTAHERQLRGRYGRLYRPDGHAPQYHRAGDGRACFAGGKNVSHRLPLRRICKVGYSAFVKSRRGKVGHFRVYFPSRRRPDGGRACAGAQNQGQGALFGRPPLFFEGAPPRVYGNIETGRGTRDFSRKRSLLYVFRRRAVRGKRGRGTHVRDHRENREQQKQRRHRDGRASL